MSNSGVAVSGSNLVLTDLQRRALYWSMAVSGRLDLERVIREAPPSVDGLQVALSHVGVRHFTAAEICKAGNPDAALATLGTVVLLPPKAAWPWGCALLLWAESTRNGEPIAVRHWWRPPRYNAAVKGAGKSEHLDAAAMDFYFSDFGAQRRALESLDGGGVPVSVGVGKRSPMLHVGFFARDHDARWEY